MILLLLYISYIFLFSVTVIVIRQSILSVYYKKISGYTFFIPVFIIFFIIPIITDILFDLGFNVDYTYITEATEDTDVNIFYNLYSSALLLFFNWHSKKLFKNFNGKFSIVDMKLVYTMDKIYNRFFIFFWILLFIPIAVVLFMGFDSYYSSYIGRTKLEPPSYHIVISKISLFAVIIAAYIITIILSKKKNSKKNLTYLLPILFIILFFNFWIQGKRSIVATYFLIQFTLLLVTNLISFKKMVQLVFVVSIIFFVFLKSYGKNISSDTTETYYDLRTDFSRDYGVKFAIYNDIMLERNIIPHKFDTYKFTLFFFVPRSNWPTKPQPYAVYFTNSAFGNFANDYQYGWGLTTSVFSEAISNLGVAGLLFAPLIIAYIFRKEREIHNPLFKLLSIMIGVLLLVLQPVSFMVLILVYSILLIKGNRKFVLK